MKDQHAMSYFAAEKAKLNPEQLEAVQTIDGPVMVLAGPGTGKTQVLAFRLAEILAQTDSSPRNILALTFTESGVTAMRERLVSLIGVTAYGVGIYTFHSFANRVINESGAEFYKNHSLDPIDDIAQLKLIITLLDQTQNDKIRPIRAPYFYVKPIIQAIRHLKNESVSPEKLTELCHAEIKSLQNDPENTTKSGKYKGEVKRSILTRIERLERTLAFADIYRLYEKELTERGLYDYEDMILFVLRSFEQHRDLLSRYQEQFHYILVDEYQDTNNAQNQLVRLLGDYFDNPNIFVVGDDKQSIYRFQGASMANLLDFKTWYPDAKLISLKQNYRSGQPILDHAQNVITNNTEQLTHLIPQIHTALTAQHQEATVTFASYSTSDREVAGIIKRIKDLLATGVSGNDIAILYRENSEAAGFTDLLRREGIPFHLEAGSDVLKDNDVNHLINLLELASAPDHEMALFRFLYAPYSGVNATDLVTLSRWRKIERTSWWKILCADEPPTEPKLQGWDQLQQIRTVIEGWHRYQASHNLGDTIEHIFVTSGLLQCILEQDDHLERLHRMRCFFDEIKSVMVGTYFATLEDLFDRLAIRKTYNLSLICPPMGQQNSAAVRLMTAHKSKGLEFAHVFIPNFHDGRWSNSSKPERLAFPEGIVAHHTVSEDQETDEDRRLFYVALTRAKAAVYLSCAEIDSSNKKLLPSQFLTELGDIPTETSDQQTVLPISHFFSPVPTHFVQTSSQAFLKDIVAKQAITPTGLNTFLTCPLEYLYKDVYAIPGVREPFQAYGTAVHKALELWGNWSKTNREACNNNAILSVFTETLVKEGLTQHEVERYSKLGIDVLQAYFNRFFPEWIAPLATEYSFSPHSVMLDGRIPITGKIDKIEPIKGSKHVRVIDYKTGRVRSRSEIEGTTQASDGDYKRQLVFYAVLAEADPFFPYTIGETTLAFIDDQKRFTTETFVITKQEKDDLKGLITAMHKEIIALHFEHTPHKKQFGAGESLCDMLRIDGLMTRSHSPSKEPA